MSETKHTPGPWRRDSYRSVVAPDGVSVVTARTRRIEVAEANLDLIAAAPDMLEALRKIDRVRLLFAPDDAEETRWVREALEALDAAIKKARGEK